MSYADGVKKERELFTELMTGTQSAAMRHYFFAERAANKIDDVQDTQLIPIKKVSVIGAGTMGGGIAMNFLSADIRDDPRDGAGRARSRHRIIRKNYEREEGPHDENGRSAMGQLTPTLPMTIWPIAIS